MLSLLCHISNNKHQTMADFIAFKLYGRDFRYYSAERIDTEYRGKSNDWRPIKIGNTKSGKRINFTINKKTHYAMLERVIYFVHNQNWDIYDNTNSNYVEHRLPLDKSLMPKLCVAKIYEY